jgi:hypothetical protein
MTEAVVAGSVSCNRRALIDETGATLKVELSVPGAPLLLLSAEQAWDAAAMLMFHAAEIEPELVWRRR